MTADDSLPRRLPPRHRPLSRHRPSSRHGRSRLIAAGLAVLVAATALAAASRRELGADPPGAAPSGKARMWAQPPARARTTRADPRDALLAPGLRGAPGALAACVDRGARFHDTAAATAVAPARLPAAQATAVATWVGIELARPAPAVRAVTSGALRRALLVDPDPSWGGVRRDAAERTGLGRLGGLGAPGTVRAVVAARAALPRAARADRPGRVLVSTVGRSRPFSAGELPTIAYEAARAALLALPDRGRARRDADAAAARAAVVDGAATVVAARFARRALGTAATLDARESLAVTRWWRGAPRALVRRALFGPTYGASYVCATSAASGYDATTFAALVARSPATTAAVLSPGGGAPVVATPSPTRPPGPGWRLRWAGRFGALDLLALLAGAGVAAGAGEVIAAGWAGGTAAGWARDGAVAVTVVVRARAGSTLCTALRAAAAEAFVVECAGALVTLRPGTPEPVTWSAPSGRSG